MDAETSVSADALARLRAAIDDATPPGGRAVVLIDGRSGSGKSTLADALVSAWPEAQLVRLDDVYPGWDGLEAGSLRVAERMLAPSTPRWLAWDWLTDTPGEWHELDANLPLIIEGSGTLSAANRALASFGIWVELDAATRKRRALARDGETYAPHWDRWAAQEQLFIAREQPKQRADLVVPG